ncbi:782_t:CDS:10 [Acaulospora colombiana]|uniref:782_t:CDS:1 n=1 Tax=Acaulospora colombiana TaxID=27376 RepID=A0ACA9K0Q2_9GLOM|nr:782_t:CDS:10 [Acaulospora colombiana]
MDIRNYFNKPEGTSDNKKHAKKETGVTKGQPKKREGKRRVNGGSDEEVGSKIKKSQEVEVVGKNAKRSQKKIKVEEVPNEISPSDYFSDKKITRSDNKTRKSEKSKVNLDDQSENVPDNSSKNIDHEEMDIDEVMPEKSVTSKHSTRKTNATSKSDTKKKQIKKEKDNEFDANEIESKLQKRSNDEDDGFISTEDHLSKKKQKKSKKDSDESEFEDVDVKTDIENKKVKKVAARKPSRSSAEFEVDESKPTKDTPEASSSKSNKGFSYRNFLQKRTGPSAPGSKEVPVGADNCLIGLTFVFTGDLESLSREESQDLVKRYGGKVTASGPSSRTSYVVVGDNPGPKKMEKVKQLKIPTLTEDQLLELVKTSPGKSESSGVSPKKSKPHPSSTEKEMEKILQPSSPSDSSSADTGSSQLWTEKYKPTSIKEVCGNKTQVEGLQRWLSTWDENSKKGFKFQTNNSFPAALLSGNPGIGKTTAAHLVAKNEGYDVMEFNASDARSKKALDEAVKIATHNTSISWFAHDESASSQDSENANKILIIMDEVDGMSAGDRGGMAELIKLIRKTQFFNAFREKIKFNSSNAIDELVRGANSDIRQVLTQLSSLKITHDTINYDEVKEFGKAFEKNTSMNLWTIAATILGASTWNPRNKSSLNDKLDLYFLESDLLPLMVQENYLKISPDRSSEFKKSNAGNPQLLEQIATMEAFSKAADCISDGDLADRMIHGSQHWSLMPIHGMFSCILPAYHVHGGSSSQFAFPSWLGQNSKASKYQRILKELQIHMRLKISGDKSEVRLNYIPALFSALSLPLINEGSESIDRIIESMNYYYLSKDDWDAIIELGVGSNDGEKTLKKIDKSVKSNFTRRYNASSHPIPFLKASAVSSVSKFASSAEVPDFEEAVEQEQETKEDEEAATDEDEDLSKDKFIKKRGDAGEGSVRGRRSSGGASRGRRKSSSKK